MRSDSLNNDEDDNDVIKNIDFKKVTQTTPNKVTDNQSKVKLIHQRYDSGKLELKRTISQGETYYHNWIQSFISFAINCHWKRNSKKELNVENFQIF